MRSKTISIRGYHCDSYGHVNNARYLELLEEARWHLLETPMQSGFFKKRQLLFVVVNININYRAEVKSMQEVEIKTSLIEFGKRSISLKQEIQNTSTGKLAVDAIVKFVLLNQNSMKMEAIDEEIKQVFLDLENED